MARWQGICPALRFLAFPAAALSLESADPNSMRSRFHIHAQAGLKMRLHIHVCVCVCMTTMLEPNFEVARSLASGFLATASVASAPQGCPNMPTVDSS